MRTGLTEMAEIALIRECEKRWTVTGVFPLGAQVRLTEGMRRKPDSSTNAMPDRGDEEKARFVHECDVGTQG